MPCVFMACNMPPEKADGDTLGMSFLGVAAMGGGIYSSCGSGYIHKSMLVLFSVLL